MIEVLVWDQKRWPNFKAQEFACKCGCGINGMSPKTLDLCQDLRRKCGFPLMITSGYRCPNHNSSVSETGTDGPHTTGEALDIRVDRKNAHTLLKHALALGFTGIGVQQKGKVRFIHLDTIDDCLTRPTVWSY